MRRFRDDGGRRIPVGRAPRFCHSRGVEPPSASAEVWAKRYAELLGHGGPDARARALASDLAAAAVLNQARVQVVGAPPTFVAAPAAPARTLRMAKMDGYGLLIMGIPSVILAGLSASPSGIGIGCVVTFCGACELDGLRRYLAGLPGARLRLMGSQLALIALAWGYAAWSLIHPEPLSPEISDLIRESGEDASAMQGLVAQLRWTVAAAICAVTLLYQGGLTVYYGIKVRERR